MEKIEYKPNQREMGIEKGENVTIHAIFIRHGEKKYDPNNPETTLTPEGEIKSLEFGKSRTKKDMIKPYTSDTPRTRRTAELATESSPMENKGTMRTRKEISFTYDENGQFLLDVMKIKKDILGEDFNNLDDEEKQKRLKRATIKQVDFYLNFKDRRPDPMTYSPVETASGIAKLVDRYIKMSGKLNSGSNVDLVNATHDFNLAAFLKETIVREIEEKKVRGFQSIEEIGGSMDFNENFEIIINRKDQNNISAKISFRGLEYELDMDRIKELVEVAKKLEKKHDK